MDPNQSRAARAMCKFSIDHVCKHAPIGKRTLVEFEAGTRKLNSTTYSTLKSFYFINGISFESDDEYEIIRYRTYKTDLQLSTVDNNPIVEYPSHLRISELIDHSNAISNMATTSSALLPLSTKIIVNAMKLNNINQKLMSQKLDCSLAFFNAIILGHKKLPERMASDVANILELSLDLRKILSAEAEISKLFKDMNLMGNQASLLSKEIADCFTQDYLGSK